MQCKTLGLIGLTIIAFSGPVVAQPGSLNTAFDNDGKQEVYFDLGTTRLDEASGVARQADGKWIVVGTSDANKAGSPAGDQDFSVTRLLSNGALDPTFGSGGKATFGYDQGSTWRDWASDVEIQSDGKILILGSVKRTYGGDQDMAVIRLLPNGALDSSFGIAGWAVVYFDLGSWKQDLGYDLEIQSDGKILISGAAENLNHNHDMAVARLTADGYLDSSFGQNGRVSISMNQGAATAMVIQPDGKIVLAGSFESRQGDYDFVFARLLPNGNLDSSFDGDGLQTVAFDIAGFRHDLARGLAIQSDGKLVAVGKASNIRPLDYDFAVVRLQSNGSLDPAFGTQGRRTVAFDLGGDDEDVARAVAIQDDGKILVGGSAYWTTHDSDYALARLNSDGSLDPTFSGDGKATFAFDLGHQKTDWLADMLLFKSGSSHQVVLVGEVDRATDDTDFGIAQVNL